MQRPSLSIDRTPPWSPLLGGLLLTLALPAACTRPSAEPLKVQQGQGNAVVVEVVVEDPAQPADPDKVQPKKPAKAKKLDQPDPADPLRYRRLALFSTSGEFDGYIGAVREAYQREIGSRRSARGLGGLSAGGAPAPPTSTAAPEAAASAADGADKADASITNNQESGVDEGDIVKAVGDFFVILRRGRLFSVRQRDAGDPTLTAVGRADAYPRGSSRGTWYDEMLIHRDRIIVIGYSYAVGGTEVGLFRLGADGAITHEATRFLRSNDYYSSRNYASRLIGSKLIFYMPYYLSYHGAGKPPLPAVTSWQPGRRRARPWTEILSKLEVYRPVQRTLTPTLHTVVQCDLAQPSFDCTARAVIGPYSRTFYVARDAVYIWVAPGHGGYLGADDGARAQTSPAYLYRMPILGGEVTAARARGNPIDQFSFKLGADRQLNVLLTAQGGGDWMGNPERGARGRLALLRLPPAAFSTAPAAAQSWRYTIVPRPDKGHTLQNRFVGNWVLWGAGAGWWRQADNGGRLYATNVRRPADVRELSLDHGVDRIEAMGADAVVVGSGKRDLFFTSIALSDDPTVRHTWVRANAAQGETRSHGFFFLPTRGGGGTLGLPVRTAGRPGLHLVHGSAEVVFLRVSPGLRFASLGTLASRATGAVQDGCVVSCVDWYGNARPIFFRGRVFALLGYELVEGRLHGDGDGLAEQARISFLQPATRARPFFE